MTKSSTSPSVGWIVATVVGAVLALLALGMGAVGTAFVAAHATQRDADGFFTSDTGRLETVGYALTSEDIDLGFRRGSDAGRFDIGDVATVRVTVDSQSEAPIFVGIGATGDVAGYLDGVAYAAVTDLELDPFRATYRFVEGGEPEGLPATEAFWAATSSGPGSQTLEWELESGRWTIVVMNADGSAGVGVDVAVGVKASWVLPAGVGLLAAAAVVLIVGAVLLVVGVAGLSRRTVSATMAHEAAAPAGRSTPYPLQLEGTLDAPSRWLWLVKWILLIPHLFVLAVLWPVFAVLTVIAGFAILFTGRYPRTLFDFNVGVLRWNWRVAFYSFGAFATDQYPPFTLGPAPDYPAQLDVAYPEQLSRGLVLVKWWLLAIPHYVVLALLGGGAILGWSTGNDGWTVNGPGLIGWLVLVAAVVLLFNGLYPKALFDLVIGLNRWAYRVIAYAALMTDQYPPFRLDQGGSEVPAPPSPNGNDSDRVEAKADARA